VDQDSRYGVAKLSIGSSLHAVKHPNLMSLTRLFQGSDVTTTAAP